MVSLEGEGSKFFYSKYWRPDTSVEINIKSHRESKTPLDFCVRKETKMYFIDNLCVKYV